MRPLSIFVRKRFPWKTEINNLIRRLTEAGIIEMWRRSFFQPPNLMAESTAVPLSVDHNLCILFLTALGLIGSILLFVAELVIFQMEKFSIHRRRRRKRFWTILHRLVDGDRHLLIFTSQALLKTENRRNFHKKLLRE